jgi:hypothetical protein
VKRALRPARCSSSWFLFVLRQETLVLLFHAAHPGRIALGHGRDVDSDRSTALQSFDSHWRERLLRSGSHAAILATLTVGLGATSAQAQFVCQQYGGTGAGASAGSLSVACGTDAAATGTGSMAFGYKAIGAGNYSSALGYFASTPAHSGPMPRQRRATLRRLAMLLKPARLTRQQSGRQRRRRRSIRRRLAQARAPME